MRLKLEEEYAKNNDNHEEEVQLRLKFEGKLNNLNRDMRMAETTLLRTQTLNKEYKEKIEDLQKQNEIFRN